VSYIALDFEVRGNALPRLLTLHLARLLALDVSIVVVTVLVISRLCLNLHRLSLLLSYLRDVLRLAASLDSSLVSVGFVTLSEVSPHGVLFIWLSLHRLPCFGNSFDHSISHDTLRTINLCQLPGFLQQLDHLNIVSASELFFKLLHESILDSLFILRLSLLDEGVLRASTNRTFNNDLFLHFLVLLLGMVLPETLHTLASLVLHNHCLASGHSIGLLSLPRDIVIHLFVCVLLFE